MYAKILVGATVMISAGILFFSNSTQDKNIPAQVEPIANIVRDEKPLAREYIKVEETISDETYKFPEIKMQVENLPQIQND